MAAGLAVSFVPIASIPRCLHYVRLAGDSGQVRLAPLRSIAPPRPEPALCVATRDRIAVRRLDKRRRRASVAAVAGVSGQKARTQYAQLGLWQADDVVLSIPCDSAVHGIGQWDRVVFPNTTLPFSLKFTRGGPDELLRYTQLAAIDRVFWLNNAGDAIIFDFANR